MDRFVILHPNLQHSHQLAQALYEVGKLQRFISGIPVRTAQESSPWWMPNALSGRIKIVTVPARLRHHPRIWWPLLKIATSLSDQARSHDETHRVMHAFDRWAAKQVLRLRPTAVIAYENSAFETFRAAKSINARCILDAPAFHHAAASRLTPPKSRGYLSEINRRKDLEVAAADLILTCSDIARESYLDSGTSSSKVRSVPLGATLPTNFQRTPDYRKSFRFIFAGTMRPLKSIDLIFEAFEQIHAEHPDTELLIAGGSEGAEWVKRAQSTGGVTYFGQLSQQALFGVLADSDCLLLPSRFDSFGMVVAEAMAAGVPVIVSTMVGARTLVAREPMSGWVIEPTLSSLVFAMRSALDRQSKWDEHRTAAARCASQFTWADYRRRAVAELMTIAE